MQHFSVKIQKGLLLKPPHTGLDEYVSLDLYDSQQLIVQAMMCDKVTYFPLSFREVMLAHSYAETLINRFSPVKITWLSHLP